MGKRRFLNRLYNIIIFLMLAGTVSGQDPQFTQFYANPLYLAPSFAGATQDHRFATNYRNQWPEIPGAFQTYSFSYDHFFANFNSGIGILLLHDKAGAGNLSQTNIGLQYSYDFMVNDIWHVRPGVHFKYSSFGITFGNLIFNAPNEVPPTDITGDVDFEASVMTYSDKFWFGTSFDHLLKPNPSFYEEKSVIPMKINVFGGARLLKRGRLLKPIDETISIAFNFKHQDKFNQLDLGLYWSKMPIAIGLWYRGVPPFNSDRGDALALLLGYKSNYVNIGYSYDFTISNLVTSTGGAHEISLTYEFKTRKRRRMHAVPCPEF